ncbi:unnamed protein product, partial [Protopolystoma xenopodis]
MIGHYQAIRRGPDFSPRRRERSPEVLGGPGTGVLARLEVGRINEGENEDADVEDVNGGGGKEVLESVAALWRRSEPPVIIVCALTVSKPIELGMVTKASPDGETASKGAEGA